MAQIALVACPVGHHVEPHVMRRCATMHLACCMLGYGHGVAPHLRKAHQIKNDLELEDELHKYRPLRGFTKP